MQLTGWEITIPSSMSRARYSKVTALLHQKMYREIPASDAFQIEFDIRLGNENFIPKEDYYDRGIVTLTHGSNQDKLLMFSHEGQAYSITGKNPICRWKPGKWYYVKIRFEKGEKKSKILIDLGGAKCAISCPVYAVESKDENVILQFSSGIGIVWIDNVRVWRVME